MAYTTELGKQRADAWQREQAEKREASRHRAEALNKWAPGRLAFMPVAEIPRVPVKLADDLDAIAEQIHNRLKGAEEQPLFEALIARLEAEPASLALKATRMEELYLCLLDATSIFVQRESEYKARIEELESGLGKAHAEIEAGRGGDAE